MRGPSVPFTPAELLDALKRIFTHCGRKPRAIHVGLSGGADSSALLAAVSGLGEPLDASIGAIHVNHGAHPAAGEWEQHCQELCERLGRAAAAAEVESDPHGGRGPEAEWRHQRYRALAALLNEDDCLLTAHHREDQAETLLLQLMRGSGLPGLAGMPAWRPLGRALLARPLLDISRDALEAYLREQDLGWVEDPANADPGLDRAFIRHQVLPLLEQRWPSARDMLARSAGHAREALELHEQWVHDLLKAAIGPCTELQLSRLPAAQPVVLKAAVRGWLQQLGAAALPMARLEELCRQVQRARPDSAIEVRWASHGLRLYRGQPLAAAGRSCATRSGHRPGRPAIACNWAQMPVAFTWHRPHESCRGKTGRCVPARVVNGWQAPTKPYG